MVDKVDKEELISQVQNNQIIWLKPEKGHNIRSKVNKAWSAILKHFNLEEEDRKALRAKWQTMLNRYARELKKAPKQKSGAAATSYKSTWEHFESMKFLQKIPPKKSTGNLAKALKQNQDESDEEEEDDDEEYKEDSDVEIPQPSKMSRRAKHPVAFDKYAPSTSGVANQSSSDASEDLMFFKTLLAHLSHLSPAERLKLRSRVTDDVKEICYNKKPSEQKEELKRKLQNDKEEKNSIECIVVSSDDEEYEVKASKRWKVATIKKEPKTESCSGGPVVTDSGKQKIADSASAQPSSGNAISSLHSSSNGCAIPSAGMISIPPYLLAYPNGQLEPGHQILPKMPNISTIQAAVNQQFALLQALYIQQQMGLIPSTSQHQQLGTSNDQLDLTLRLLQQWSVNLAANSQPGQGPDKVNQRQSDDSETPMKNDAEESSASKEESSQKENKDEDTN